MKLQLITKTVGEIIGSALFASWFLCRPFIIYPQKQKKQNMIYTKTRPMTLDIGVF
jgi:hypothetical protein